MAKVTVTFQEPTDEYEASNQRMMKFKFEQLKTELNTSYQRTIENDSNLKPNLILHINELLKTIHNLFNGLI